MPNQVTFHPQRLFPAFARVALVSGIAPGGLAVASRAFSRVMFNDDVSTTENINVADLDPGAVVMCAFPRSGSTFLQAAAGEYLGGDPVLKSHDVLALRSYSRAALHVLVPVRRPDANVASWSLYNSDEPSLPLVRARLDTYTAWHRELARASGLPGVHLLDFEKVTSAAFETLESVNLPVSARLVSVGVPGAGIDAYADQASTSEHQRHLPSAGKKAASRPYLDLLEHPSLRHARARAWDAHQQLNLSSTADRF